MRRFHSAIQRFGRGLRWLRLFLSVRAGRATLHARIFENWQLRIREAESQIEALETEKAGLSDGYSRLLAASDALSRSVAESAERNRELTQEREMLNGRLLVLQDQLVLLVQWRETELERLKKEAAIHATRRASAGARLLSNPDDSVS